MTILTLIHNRQKDKITTIMLESRMRSPSHEANIGSMIHTILLVFRKNEWYRPW